MTMLMFCFLIFLCETAFCQLAPSAGFQRTVVFIKRQSYPSQYVFLRGGRNDGSPIPIRHRVKPTIGSDSRYYDWSQGDNNLDWDAQENGQWNFKSFQKPGGTPLMWTTNVQGTVNVTKDGAGYTPINTMGPHYWMMDVDMDCNKTDDGWFQLKAFVVHGEKNDYISWNGNNGEWERGVEQTTCWGDHKKFSGVNNHVAKCGAINVFTYGEGTPCVVSKSFGDPLLG
ncbi:uncharacterized protein LOC106182099 [Lingula anatina]|uniref:Uncharacterized protein LOC106182099 n=1 Tax=Lingula anatina TaxID=7574 RepID=A0A1S3KHU2_LINAN|nr:uncharacterized protein LOC106182099 [Lingula anatina]|eukprot:XP_013422198.1 uncharacterized protein LOC106182099 [Lingula anatina]